jgi:glycolate oxidase FAD binding subunit
VVALAAVCAAAHTEGWRARIEAGASWQAADAPADVAISTANLVDVTTVSPDDLVATVQAGVPLDALARQLADRKMWLAIDAPGRPERTLGSVLATGTSGPLRHGYGPVRDHVLGCTLVTGDGRIIRPGGKVVKNVAGFDLTRLQVGAFGGFGIITDVHLRLRAVPEADRTLAARGTRDDLTRAGRDVMEAGLDVQVLELLSPGVTGEVDWLLVTRLLGTHEGTTAEVERLRTAAALDWVDRSGDAAASLFRTTARAFAQPPVTARLGVLLEGLDETIDLVEQHLGAELISAGAGSGTLRWGGSTNADALRDLRRALAAREIPLTIERAPWPLRRAVGHFGAYREGVGLLVARLRESFDPGGRMQVALDGEA